MATREHPKTVADQLRTAGQKLDSVDIHLKFAGLNANNKLRKELATMRREVWKRYERAQRYLDEFNAKGGDGTWKAETR